MRVIDGKQLPTQWSDLAIDEEEIQQLDSSPSVSMKCVTDWIAEANVTLDNISSDNIADIIQRGVTTQDYLIAVKCRMEYLYKTQDLAYHKWKSKTMSEYGAPGAGQKPPSESARERMVIVEEQYQIHKNFLIRLETIDGWCEKTLWSLRDRIKLLGYRIQIRLQTQPKLPIA